MSILSRIRRWLPVPQRETDVTDGTRSLDEAAEEAYSNSGLPDGYSVSPAGTPTDWTADQKKPKY